MVAELLGEAGLAPSVLDCVAFGAGPGSFTGLRIACGVAQGLALGAGARVVPVGTLLALAEECGAERVIACIDARMGEVYHAAYRREADAWIEVVPPSVGKPEQAPAVPGSGWVGCGSGFAAHGAALQARYADTLVRIEPALHPHARAIGRVAISIALAGGGLPPEKAVPVYVRDNVALKMHEQR